jgi:hypothetical protein
MGFHPITGWFGVNNIIGWVVFNFLIFLDECEMDIKVIRFGYGWRGLDFLPLAGLDTKDISYTIDLSPNFPPLGFSEVYTVYYCKPPLLTCF